MIGLHYKGLTQMEIARELNVDQSTISRDLHYIKEDPTDHENLSDPFEVYIPPILVFL